MAFEIGDRVLVNGSEAVIEDKMYSVKSDTYFYEVLFTGTEEVSDVFYSEDEIAPFPEEKTEWEFKMETSEGLVIFSCFEQKGQHRALVARGHAHILRNDLLGMLQAASYAAKQAASYAAKRAFTELNCGDIYIEKKEK